MSTPLRGYEGSITAASEAVTWVSNWSLSLETEQTEIGPFISDGGTKYTFTSSRKLTGSIEATIPSGTDTGQTELLSGAINGSNVALVLTMTGGYTINLTAIVNNFEMSQDAEDTNTLSFDFESTGGFTIA